MKVSIITAVYNNSESIQDSINSVNGQTYTDIEHIIIDGGSSDGTIDIIEKNRTKSSIFVSEPDNGIYDALNKGVRLASGDIIGFMHSDDIFSSGSVIQCIVDEMLKSHCDMVYGNLQYVKKDAPHTVIRNWESGEFTIDKLKWGWMPPHPTVYLKKEVYKRFGLFDTSFRIAADYDFMLRILRNNDLSVRYIPEVFVKMRVGGESNSVLNYKKKWTEDLKAMQKNDIGGILPLAWKNISKLVQFF